MHLLISPVKIIRLVGQSTVEEVILGRAEAKMKLTNTVIEGGQFSLGAGKSDDNTDNNNMEVPLHKICPIKIDS